MGMQEIDARVSNGTLIEWTFDRDMDKHYIRIVDEDGTATLHPRNGREAIDMFQHTFVYDWTPDNIIIGEGRDFLAKH